MDLGALFGESWRVLRKARPLWGLGLISAAQAGLYLLIVLGLIVPMSLFTQLIVANATPGASGIAGADAIDVQQASSVVLAWIAANKFALVAGIIGIVVVWAFFGVLDVAATAGTIAETAGFERGEAISTGAGMRAGFGVWWRTVGLLAFAALPSLVYLLAFALFTLVTISIPLVAGQAPNIDAMRSGDAINSMISGLVGIIGIPLGVLVQIGLRFGVFDGQSWRPALGSAWRLTKSRFGDVALVYLAQLGISLVAAFAVAVVMSIIGVIGGGAIGLLVYASGGFSAGAIIASVIMGIVLVIVLTVLSAGVFVWTSALWTVFWLRTTAPMAVDVGSPGSVAST